MHMYYQCGFSHLLRTTIFMPNIVQITKPKYYRICQLGYLCNEQMTDRNAAISNNKY